MSTRIFLPVIPKPKEGTASVIVPSEGFQGPLFKGAEDIDLHCSSCSYKVAEGMASGQMKNMVLQCPGCRSYNAIISIPKIEQFVEKLQSSNLTSQSIPKFREALAKTVKEETTHEEFQEYLELSLPELSWFKEFIVPSNAGEMYAMLAFILALITWYQTVFKSKNAEPRVIVNNYFTGNDPFQGAGRNAPCPCGSGLKFKKCHGK